MIRAAILDIDGIILGHKDGVNFPLPSPAVIEHLQTLAKQMPVSLCSVKPYFAVEPIIQACGLENWFHITDAGASLVNKSTNTRETTSLDSHAIKFLNALEDANIYTEWYSGDKFNILSADHSFLIESRAKLLGKIPVVQQPTKKTVVDKIIILPLDDIQTTSLNTIASKFTKYFTVHWGVNPSKIPQMAAFVTNPLATKRTGAQRLAELHKVPLIKTLAMGDSTNDWTYMEPCGYVATLSNGESELKELIRTRKNDGYVSGKSIDEDGFIDALKFFALAK